MTRFVHLEYSFEHPGVQRFEAAFAALARLVRGFDGARGIATLLLAAIVSALLVVANEVITTWTDGHLLAAWMVSWAVAFAVLAWLAVPARRGACALRRGFRARSAAARLRPSAAKQAAQ